MQLIIYSNTSIIIYIKKLCFNFSRPYLKKKLIALNMNYYINIFFLNLIF